MHGCMLFRQACTACVHAVCIYMHTSAWRHFPSASALADADRCMTHWCMGMFMNAWVHACAMNDASARAGKLAADSML